ncbi:MAG: RluA family pseudouridine synthase [Candidatus Magasanikbacteria bacterium]
MSNKKKGINILYENKNFAAVDKPSGLLVHPQNENEAQKTPKDREYTLTDYLVEKYPKMKKVGDKPSVRPGIVHRLDRPTSGVLITAKTQKFFNYFKKLLKHRKIEKKYLALVWDEIKNKGKVEKALGRKKNTTRWTTWGSDRKTVKEALTKHKPLEILKSKKGTFTFVELKPVTGRTHQLRSHMLSIHHPVVGDSKYGKDETLFNLKRPFLHSYSIKFKNIKNKKIKIGSNLPFERKKVLQKINSKEFKNFC